MMDQELLKDIDESIELCAKVMELGFQGKCMSEAGAMDVYNHALSIQVRLEGAKREVLDLRKSRAIAAVFTVSIVFLLLAGLIVGQLCPVR